MRELKNLQRYLGPSYKSHTLTNITSEGFRELESAFGDLCRATSEKTYLCP